MPIIRAKFNQIYLENVPNQSPIWTWKNIDNLRNADGRLCELKPIIEPYTFSGLADTRYLAPRIVLKGLDKTFVDVFALKTTRKIFGGFDVFLQAKMKYENQSNFKIGTELIYGFFGNGEKTASGNPTPGAALERFRDSGVIGTNEGTGAANDNKEFFMTRSFFAQPNLTQPATRFVTYEDFNDPNFGFAIELNIRPNNYDSRLHTFGFDYFVVDISWDDKSASYTTNFLNAYHLDRTTQSTIKPTARPLPGFTWNNTENALADNEELDNYACADYNPPSKYTFDHPSTDAKPGIDKFYYTDYLIFNNINFKIPLTTLDAGGNIVPTRLTGMIFRYRKRGSKSTQFLVNNKWRLAIARFFDDIIRCYNGSIFLGKNNLYPKELPIDDTSLQPWRDNLFPRTDFGTYQRKIPNFSDINNAIYGGSDDNWNLPSFTPAVINDDNFGIAVSGCGFFSWWEYLDFPYNMGIDYADLSFFYELYRIVEYISVSEGVYSPIDLLPHNHTLVKLKTNITGNIRSQEFLNSNHLMRDNKIITNPKFHKLESYSLPTLELFGNLKTRILITQEFVSNLTRVNANKDLKTNLLSSSESFLRPSFYLSKNIPINILNDDSQLSNLHKLEKSYIIRPNSIKSEESLNTQFVNDTPLPKAWILNASVGQDSSISEDNLLYNSSQIIENVKEFTTFENQEYNSESGSINYDWLMPENVEIFSDGSYSQIYWTSESSEPQSTETYLETDYLIAKNVKLLDIDDNNFITGIKVVVNKLGSKLTENGFRTEDVELRLTLNGSLIGENKAKLNQNWPTINDGFAVSVYGSNTDKWGLSLRGIDVKDSSFGVAIRAKFKYGNLSESDLIELSEPYKVFIDFIGIEITSVASLPNVQPKILGSGELTSNQHRLIQETLPAEGCLNLNFSNFENQEYDDDGNLTARYFWNNENGAQLKNDGQTASIDKQEP